jgi:hypothetical protein
MTNIARALDSPDETKAFEAASGKLRVALREAVGPDSGIRDLGP